MLALGKLSAGLAHALNNPAAAMVSSSTRLRKVLIERRKAAIAMRSEVLSKQTQDLMSALGERLDECREHDVAMELADRSQDIGDWLDGEGISVVQEIADRLASAGFNVNDLSEVLPHLKCHQRGAWLELADVRSPGLVPLARN